LRTININLIGDLGKVSKKVTKPVPNKSSEISTRTKAISIGAVFFALIIFTISFGSWFFIRSETEKTGIELDKLKAEHESLKIELEKSLSNHRIMMQEKKLLDAKALAQTFIRDSSLPWHNILVDIANAIPKDLTITRILKVNSTDISSGAKIAIEGSIYRRAGVDPLKTVSFFIININDNPKLGSLLSKATIKSFSKKKEGEKYDFTVEAYVNIPGLYPDSKSEDR
jgi:hypothetical protein